MVSESDPAFTLLAEVTGRLASTASVEEITRTVSDEIAKLGFGAIWIAVIDEATAELVTVRELIDGRDIGHEMPRIAIVDMRQPIAHGFRERRMINIHDPDALFIIEDHPEGIPEGQMALPRVIYEHLRGHPFACGPLLGSRGQPVGALGLSSYLGQRPIPDDLFNHGLLRAFMSHLGIAMERALHLQRLERLNVELVKAQELLVSESRMRAVGELAAAVAHDLNNYSNVALMAVALLREGATNSSNALLRIERASRAIGDLAGRLQRVARTGADSRGGATDLRQVVDDLTHLFTPLCIEALIKLETNIPAESPLFVAADATMVRQAVMNILLNAREAALSVPPERRRVVIGLGRHAESTALSIRDHGPGIPAEVLDEIFKPFVTTKRGHAGLGLATAYSSMKHFGGKLEVRNESDGGARFTLTFASAEGGVSESTPPPLMPGHGRLRILVVDDEPDFAEMLHSLLHELGHDVAAAHDAKNAVAILRRSKFDVVLCDVGLPGRSGLDLIGLLGDEAKATKIVLMSGWDTEAVKADPRVSRCHGLLQKPFDARKIENLLSSLFP